MDWLVAGIMAVALPLFEPINLNGQTVIVPSACVMGSGLVVRDLADQEAILICWPKGKLASVNNATVWA
jgi:hypothetical protein